MSPWFSDVLIEKLDCGCTFGFVPSANVSCELPLEKSFEILNAYDQLYSTLLSDFLPRKVLEIGVKHGGSLALFEHVFSKIFGKDSCPEIVGIDREPKLTALSAAHLERHVAHVSVVTAEAPGGLDAVEGPFDLVIDDGSHAFEDILGTFETLWPRMSPGGVYVVEDWRTDASRPFDFMRLLLDRMFGYWPDVAGPGNGAPVKIDVFRDLLAIRKGGGW